MKFCKWKVIPLFQSDFPLLQQHSFHNSHRLLCVDHCRPDILLLPVSLSIHPLFSLLPTLKAIWIRPVRLSVFFTSSISGLFIISSLEPPSKARKYGLIFFSLSLVPTAPNNHDFSDSANLNFMRYLFINHSIVSKFKYSSISFSPCQKFKTTDFLKYSLSIQQISNYQH